MAVPRLRLLRLMACALFLASCSPGTVTDTLEGTLTGDVQFGGDGNHDGLVNAKGCNEDQDVDDFFKVTTYTTLQGAAGDLGVVEVRMAHCNSPDGPQEGQVAVVTDTGDVLFGEYTAAEGQGDPVGITFMPTTTQDRCYLLGADDSEVDCRSTGPFADAEGSAKLIVAVNQTADDPFVPWDASALWVDASVTHSAG